MRQSEGLSFVKFMMLLSSMAPLFILLGIKGIDTKIISDNHLWYCVGSLIVFPLTVLLLRIHFAKKSNDSFVINTSVAKSNKEYLFAYLFTVLLPLYSLSVSSQREFGAMIAAIIFVIFILWNLNLHFINIFFAILGYRVFTIESYNSAILLTTRHAIPSDLTQLKVHRLSNTVFIEFKNHNYANN